MVLLFKVGDFVWAKTSGYSATFYHRPCKVLSAWGDIRVEINGWHEDIDIDRVIYTRWFYV